MTTRRAFLLGAGALAAPAIIRIPGLLMPVRNFVRSGLTFAFKVPLAVISRLDVAFDGNADVLEHAKLTVDGNPFLAIPMNQRAVFSWHAPPGAELYTAGRTAQVELSARGAIHVSGEDAQGRPTSVWVALNPTQEPTTVNRLLRAHA